MKEGLTLSKDYVVGLVDGEGSFTAYIRNPDRSIEPKRRVFAEPKFYVKLVGEDKLILDKLKRFFGCGAVYFQKDSRPNHRDCYRFEVGNRFDLENKIIPFFRKNILCFPSKRKDFMIFCQIMSGIKKGDHLKPNGLRSLYNLKQKMH